MLKPSQPMRSIYFKKVMTMKEVTAVMSIEELSRIEVIKKIISKHIRLFAGARILSLSKRQMIRLVQRYRAKGALALASKRRSLLSNHRYSDAFKAQVMALVNQHYYDFGPTFASEKLLTEHDLHVSKETLRQWMMSAELWHGKAHHTHVLHRAASSASLLG
jgi:hypothetical protein